MGLDWNIRNENGTLISVVSLAHRLKREIQLANSAFAQEYAHQQYRLLHSKPQQQPVQHNHTAQNQLRSPSFQILFFAKVLREIARRESNPYRPYLLTQSGSDALQQQQQPHISVIYSSKLQLEWFDKVLQCMGLALAAHPQKRSKEKEEDSRGGSGGGGGGEKKAMHRPTEDKKTSSSSNPAKKEQKDAIEFVICYPLWVYNKFADIIVKAGNA